MLLERFLTFVLTIVERSPLVLQSMKATLNRLNLAVALTFFASYLFAQIPNGGFENWVDEGGYIEPIGWLTYNDVITTGGPLASVEQGTPGFPGTYHCVIISRAVPSGSPIQGWISAGSSSGQAGFPYTQRPAMLTGQWQYGVQAGDTAEVFIALSKWNSGTSSAEAIAFGILQVTGNLGTWQGFSVPLEYISADAPDTAYIQIVSSIDFYQPVVGSFVKVDDLAFVGSVGIPEQALTEVRVFPSPAADALHITTTVSGALRLFDASGRVLLHSTINGTRTLDVSSFAPGLYSYQLVDKDGIPVAAGRWVKE